MKSKRWLISIILFIGLFGFVGCGKRTDEGEHSVAMQTNKIVNRTTTPETEENIKTEQDAEIEKNTETKQDMEAELMLLIEVNGTTLEAELADNSSAKALVELIMQEGSLTINLHDYSNFEKVGSLPQSIPTNDENINTDYGDIILYQGNQFVLYYDTNSWTFTRLGHVNGVSKEELKKILGSGDVTITLKISA